MKLRLGRTELELSYTLLCAAGLSVLLGVWKDFVWCAVAIALHEGGHLLLMARYGCLPERIKIALFAIDIVDGHRGLRSDKQNAQIIFFGPFANFVCFSVSFLLYLKGIHALLPFAAANLSVGLFNSLPVPSLDGGQLLYLLLCRRMPPGRAGRSVKICAALCLAGILPAGAVLAWRSHNPSLLFIGICLALALAAGKGRFE